MDVYYLSPSAHPSSSGKLLHDLLQEDKDLLTKILQNIEHIAAIAGHPQPPVAKPLHGYAEIREIRTTFGRGELLRIYYFVDNQNKRMILMNYTRKPDGDLFPSKYQGNAGKKLKKKLQESIDEAVTIHASYAIDQYEKFPIVQQQKS